MKIKELSFCSVQKNAKGVQKSAEEFEKKRDKSENVSRLPVSKIGELIGRDDTRQFS
jgi:hypothetical protein